MLLLFAWLVQWGLLHTLVGSIMLLFFAWLVQWRPLHPLVGAIMLLFFAWLVQWGPLHPLVGCVDMARCHILLLGYKITQTYAIFIRNETF